MGLELWTGTARRTADMIQVRLSKRVVGGCVNLSAEVDYVEPETGRVYLDETRREITPPCPAVATQHFHINTVLDDTEQDEIEIFVNGHRENTISVTETTQYIVIALLDRNVLPEAVGSAYAEPLRGLAVPAGMITSPGVNGYAKDLDERLALDREMAKQLLAVARGGDRVVLLTTKGARRTVERLFRPRSR